MQRIARYSVGMGTRKLKERAQHGGQGLDAKQNEPEGDQGFQHEAMGQSARIGGFLADDEGLFDDLVKNHGVIAKPLPVEILKKLREVTNQVLADAASNDPLVKKVHDSFMAFKTIHDKWAGISEAVYQNQIRG